MKSKKTLLLKEAFKAYRKNKFSEAAVLLEKIVSYKPSHPYPYFLLSLSYLLNAKFNDAENMLKKAKAIDPGYLPLHQLEAFLLFKSASDVHTALTVYIDKLDNFPGDKYIKRSLRQLHISKEFSTFQKNAKLKNFVFVPGPDLRESDFPRSLYENPDHEKTTENETVSNKRSNSKVIFAFTAICLFLTIGIFSYFYFFDYFNEKIQKFNHKVKTTEFDSAELNSVGIDVLQYDLIDKIQTAKPLVFYYSNDEVINDFNKAKDLIKNEKYNDAILLINKISSSNANFRVKERNDFLRKFIANIDHKEYSSIPVEKIFQKPHLYIGSFVKWKGKIANLRKKEKNISFNLLIDYRKDDNFSGVIDVFSQKDYTNINNGDFIAIEGIFVNTTGSSRLYLVADSIYKDQH